jgi:hypothetical protein
MSAMAVSAIVRIKILLILPLLLVGCVTLPDPETSQENNHEIVSGGVEGSSSIGQSFTALRPRLNGITIGVTWEASDENRQAWVTLRLYNSLEQAVQGIPPLHNMHISIQHSGPLSISFPPLDGKAGQGYYLELIPSDSSVLFQGQNLDAYTGGQAYLDRQPLDADLAFRTTYQYDGGALLSDIGDIGRRIGMFVPLALTLLVPGWLMLDLSGLRKRFDGGEQVALSLGLSLALIPILMLWTSALGIGWTRASVITVSTVLGLLMLWRIFLLRRSFSFGWVGLFLGVIFTATLVVRMAMVRDLVAPAWVDPVHHALITRLTMDQGTFPETYAPYLELGSTVYHAGYHSTQAVFQWLSGLDLLDGMLLYGQVLNAATIFAVYLLTTTLTGDKRAALFAAWIAGLFTPMPAYYVSWGRYTQLAGLLVLPVPLALLRLVFENSPGLQRIKEAQPEAVPVSKKRKHKKFHHEPLGLLSMPLFNRELLGLWGLVCLSVAGLLIMHYRVVAFLSVLAVAYFASLLFDRGRLKKQALFTYFKELLAAGFVILSGTLLLTLPWMIEVIPNQLIPAFTPAGVVTAEPFSDFSWSFLTAAMGTHTLYLAAAGVVIGLILQRRFVITGLLWVALLFTLANLGALGLPGGQVFNNTSVAIMLFMPIGLFGGVALSSLIAGIEWLLVRRKFTPKLFLPLRVSLFAAVLIFSYFGARSLLPLLNQATYLFRAADRPALAWIEQNIPREEAILINPFSWGYGLCAGADGGAWISALSGQPTMPPPVIYGFGDQPYIQRINSFCSQVLENGHNPDLLWELMRAEGIRYVYTGLHGGPISPAALRVSPLFDTLYAQDGAYVFQSLGW